MKLFAYLRSYIQWFAFGLTLLVYVVLIFLFGWMLSPNALEALLRAFSGQMVWISGIDLHVHGKENLDPKKSYIVMFNHFNFLDHFVIYSALKLRLRGLEKEAHFHWPVYGLFMKQIGIIPIPPRGNTEKALQALDIAKNKFHEGYSMLIAPEGTRTKTGNLGPFKKGGFHLAVQTQAEILPVIFQGMYAFNQKGSKLLTPGRVDLFIEPSIPTTGLFDDQVTMLKNKVENIYKAFYEKLD